MTDINTLKIMKAPMMLTPEQQKDMWQDLLAFWSWYPD